MARTDSVYNSPGEPVCTTGRLTTSRQAGPGVQLSPAASLTSQQSPWQAPATKLSVQLGSMTDGQTDRSTSCLYYKIIYATTRPEGLFFCSIHDFIMIGITAFDTQVSTGQRSRLTSLAVSQPPLKSPQLSPQHPPETAQSPRYLSPAGIQNMSNSVIKTSV